MDKVVVIAVGGNALASEKGCSDLDSQAYAASLTAKHIADVVAKGYKVVLTHGNGPQVGYILRRSELAAHEVPLIPMKYAIADTEGAIGFMFQKSLYNEFLTKKIDSKVQTVVSMVLVDKNDEAFANPNKPIGSYMDEDKARELALANDWHIMEDAGRGYRRCVASPKPQKIIELETIKTLLKDNTVVIATGGGGIPVIEDPLTKALDGVEAVIDKDLSSCLLAKELNAEALIIVTAVEKVAINFGTADEKWLGDLPVSDAKKYHEEGHFPAGSMGPKMSAAIDFVESSKTKAIITDIEHLSLALDGKSGTTVRI